MLCSRDDELYAKKYIKTFVKKRNFCRENLRYMGGYFISTVTVTDCTQKNTKLFSLNGLILPKKCPIGGGTNMTIMTQMTIMR